MLCRTSCSQRGVVKMEVGRHLACNFLLKLYACAVEKWMFRIDKDFNAIISEANTGQLRSGPVGMIHKNGLIREISGHINWGRKCAGSKFYGKPHNREILISVALTLKPKSRD